MVPTGVWNKYFILNPYAMEPRQRRIALLNQDTARQVSRCNCPSGLPKYLGIIGPSRQPTLDDVATLLPLINLWNQRLLTSMLVEVGIRDVADIVYEYISRPRQHVYHMYQDKCLVIEHLNDGYDIIDVYYWDRAVYRLVSRLYQSSYVDTFRAQFDKKDCERNRYLSGWSSWHVAHLYGQSWYGQIPVYEMGTQHRITSLCLGDLKEI